MIRPPLANLFAVHDDDPAMLDEMMLDLQRSAEFAHVWRPAPGWVAATAPLPGGESDGDMAHRHQLAFAEGRDVLVERSGKDPAVRFREIVELADFNPDRLASLPGDFGFIRFRADGDATVVRSCGGLVPFYLKQSGHRFVIATRLGDFVRYLPDAPCLDPLVNAIWASSWPMMLDGRTFLDGVTILGRGHFARREKTGRMLVGRYWNPRPKRIPYPTPALAREHAERLRTLLIEKLRRDLDPEDGNLLTLSGGVDSSSLAALAAGVVGRKVWTWSLLPRKERQDLVQHEMSFIEPLAQQYGFARRWEIHVHERLMFDLWQAAPPIVFHVVHPALCSLPAVMREAPVRVLFGGEFADVVCGSAFTVPDWVEQTPLWRLMLDFKPQSAYLRTAARWARHRLASFRGRPALPFPQELLGIDLTTKKPLDLFHPAVREEYLTWWERKRKELRGDTAPLRHLAIRSATQDAFIPMNWEACSALGIRRSFPFFNREALELAFECHPTELYGPGTKKLLRAALHNDVPSRNLYRKDKGRRDNAGVKSMQSLQEPLPDEPLPQELEGVLSPEWFSNPPKEVGYWPFRCLTRLLIFVDSLRARRQEREDGKVYKD
ncbi:MAG: asparagine synthase-related protein [Candidatus Brocadiaceae bacterium]|nr:asparagine synthase-related protein [Candidatus Brocadiaceae bacterium]